MKDRGRAARGQRVDETENAADEYHLEGLEEAWRNHRATSPGSKGSSDVRTMRVVRERAGAVVDKGRGEAEDGERSQICRRSRELNSAPCLTRLAPWKERGPECADLARLRRGARGENASVVRRLETAGAARAARSTVYQRKLRTPGLSCEGSGCLV